MCVAGIGFIDLELEMEGYGIICTEPIMAMHMRVEI
jgi:hypothetical protein